ncbi:FAD-dependent oxidoreductase domain-containing protein 1 [Diorhabda sublineata]|uniref:FAD-dependent oxidoreductase domain-containing protein 1 n=1 Tax=Diorhabda sublineata TaxID=1163346 RepID=UPI0024E14447|nr:FAD-dependent oxidoreductase domain-containing protein 1 [Diorhabda sublineata]
MKMHLRRLLSLNKSLIDRRYFHRTSNLCERKPENPIWRTLRILGEDLQFKRRAPKTPEEHVKLLNRQFPRHADVVIIGGGAIGSSIAYWLKYKTNYDGIHVVVLDKDTTFKKCSTAISMGALTQQYSLPENIQLATYGAEFLRNSKRTFGDEININFDPAGYLLLASEDGASQLEDNIKLQNEYGTINILLSPQQIKKRFPYLDVTDVAIGSLGLEREGWFNAWDMLTLIRSNAIKLGAQYINAEAIDFLFEEKKDIMVEGVEGYYQGTNQIVVKLPNEEDYRTIEFAYCIIAAGHESTEVSKLAGIGIKPGMLSIPLPIEKRQRYVYSFDCKEHVPSINTPMIEDYSGIYFRREGLAGTFLVGASPHPDFTPPSDSEEDKSKFFNEMVLPCLSRRVPAFKDVQVTGSWSGPYDYNVFDGNGIVGPHPYYINMYLATGFSNQGIQQAPGVGRAVAEMIVDGGFKTIDLTRLGFDRLIVDKPMYQLRIA